MSNELIIVLLSIGCISALAAFFVAWSKYDEQKKATEEERDRRWDEISLRLNVEKELEQSKVHQQWMQEDVLRYSEQLTKEQALGAEREEEIFRLSAWHNIMQDKLSALLCPMNDHVWRDGVCTKCGRMQDD